MHAHEPSLAAEDDHRSTLSRQRYKSGADGNSGGYNHQSTSHHHHSTETEWLSRHSYSTTNSSSKISNDSNATTPTLVGAYESGPSTVRYVYRPPSFEPSTRMTSIHRVSKGYGNPRTTSVGSLTHSARLKDKENGKSQYQENEKLKPPSNALSTIVVSPGHEARLRGAAETWQAIQQDFYVPCVCLDCEASLFCILDAWLVLCPHCRALNPIGHDDNGDMAANPDGGVGLGFTIETLMEAQASMWRDF
jgi:hypothetical protein